MNAGVLCACVRTCILNLANPAGMVEFAEHSQKTFHDFMST